MRDFRFLSGSALLGFGERAVVQPENGAIFAGLYRFNPDEPEHGDSLARSMFVQPKHAQDKSCGLRRRFRRAFCAVACLCGGICLSDLAQVKNSKAFGGIVPRETNSRQSELSGSALTVFVLMVRSAYGVKSVNAREDAGTGFDSETRVRRRILSRIIRPQIPRKTRFRFGQPQALLTSIFRL